MTNRVCGSDVSKISTDNAVKPFLVRKLENPHWCYCKKPQCGERLTARVVEVWGCRACRWGDTI